MQQSADAQKAADQRQGNEEQRRSLHGVINTQRYEKKEEYHRYRQTASVKDGKRIGEEGASMLGSVFFSHSATSTAVVFWQRIPLSFKHEK